jgi:transposase
VRRQSLRLRGRKGVSLRSGLRDAHQANPRRKGSQRPPEEGFSKKVHPGRRWVVERTISWLTKRRSLRTRWAKKAENWLALVHLACAHILLNLAVFG